MELIAVSLARVVAFLELNAIDPRGLTSVSESLKALSERYAFEKTPQSIAELDFSKGVELSSGRLGDIRIDKVTLFANAISIDTHSSTDDAESVLADVIDWAKDFAGGVVVPNRQGRVSNIIFRSDLKIAELHTVLSGIATTVSSYVSGVLRQQFSFEPSAIFIGCDHTQTSLTPVAFSVDRRSGVPFSDNSYFSVAPVPTKLHIELIEQLEKALA
jgi:hypothetical protein